MKNQIVNLIKRIKNVKENKLKAKIESQEKEIIILKHNNLHLLEENSRVYKEVREEKQKNKQLLDKIEILEKQFILF